MIQDQIERWGIEVGEVAAYLSGEINQNPAMRKHFRMLTPDMGRIEGCRLIATWALEFSARAERAQPEDELSIYEDLERFLQEKFIELIRRDTREWVFLLHGR